MSYRLPGCLDGALGASSVSHGAKGHRHTRGRAHAGVTLVSQPCTVCGHPRVAYMDRLLRGGSRSIKSVASEVGVSYAALRRHSQNHVGPATGNQPTSPSGSSGTTALPAGSTPYDVMRARVDDLAAMDTRTMSNRDRIQHSEELRRAAETLAKMTPVDPDLGTIDPMSVPGVVEVLAMIFEATDPTRGIVVEDTSDPVAVAVARGRVMERAAFRTKITEWQARYAAAAAEEGA